LGNRRPRQQYHWNEQRSRKLFPEDHFSILRWRGRQASETLLPDAESDYTSCR
jgi:hypothetical protein